MNPFLKIGNSRQNFETDKALRGQGAFDVNGGEVVEVSIDASATGSASHRVANPTGAILIAAQLDSAAGVNQVASANSLSVTLTGSSTGTLTFLVF